MWPVGRKPEREIVPLVLPESLASEIDDLLREGRDVEAVRRVREQTGAGLMVAKRAVDHHQASSRTRGCGALLVALAQIVLSGEREVCRTDFAGDEATIHSDSAEVRVRYADRPIEKALARALRVGDAPSPAANFGGGEPWPELLYDLGANLSLLERHDRGLHYLSVERLGGQARVQLARDEAQYEFLVNLTGDMVGLPDTFHDWAHRYPDGRPEPIQI